jgi:hypothetical protein
MHIAIRPDQGGELDPFAGDIAHKVAKDRESGDGAQASWRLVLPPPGDRTRHRQNGYGGRQ